MVIHPNLIRAPADAATCYACRCDDRVGRSTAESRDDHPPGGSVFMGGDFQIIEMGQAVRLGP